MSELDVISTLHGTDKSSSQSFAWDYLRTYEELFGRWRNSEVNVLEIGVAWGASLNTWHDFFEKATLIGIDLEPNCARHAKDRIVVKIGSQDDAPFLTSVADEYSPTIIIDDGSHLAHHMIASFEALFPKLLPGGVYVFEDLAFHFEEGVQWLGAKRHQGEAATPIYDYLAPFLRARASHVASPKNSTGFQRYAFEHIDSVTVFGGVVAFRKRSPRDFDQDIALFEAQLEKREFYTAKAERYARYLIKHNVNLVRAEALLREVLTAMPKHVPALIELAILEMQRGRFHDAAEAAAKVLQTEPASPQPWQRLVVSFARVGRPDLELQMLKQLAELMPDRPAIHSRLALLRKETGEMELARAAAM